MNFKYAIHEDTMTIRAVSPSESFEDCSLFDDITLSLRPYPKTILSTQYVSTENGFLVNGPRGSHGYFDGKDRKSINMIQITLSPNEPGLDGDMLDMEACVNRVKLLAQKLGCGLENVSASEFNEYIFNKNHYGEIYPDSVAFGQRSHPSKEKAKPFLYAYNSLLRTQSATPESLEPVTPQPQTIFPFGYGPHFRFAE